MTNKKLNLTEVEILQSLQTINKIGNNEISEQQKTELKTFAKRAIKTFTDSFYRNPNSINYSRLEKAMLAFQHISYVTSKEYQTRRLESASKIAKRVKF